MPTFNRLYQSHKKPEDPVQPAPWAFGMPTPKFLRRSKVRNRQAGWSAALSTTLEPGTHQADEEALVTRLSELKPTTSSTFHSSAGRSQTGSNKQVTWVHESCARPSPPSTATILNWIPSSPHRETSPVAGRSMIRSPPQSRDRSLPREEVRGASHELGIVSVSGAAAGPAVKGVMVPTAAEWPPPQLPQRLVTRVLSESVVEPIRILSPPPWHRRRSDQQEEELDHHV